MVDHVVAQGGAGGSVIVAGHEGGGATAAVSPLTSAVGKLRQLLANALRDEFEDGDVIKWISSPGNSRQYNYCAIKAAGRWWITGTANWYGKSVFEFEEFLKILQRSDVREVQVATSWSKVL